MTLLGASPAYADYFGPYYTDDARMDFHISSNVDYSTHNGLRSAINGAMQKLDTQTDIYDVSASNVAGTDILFSATYRSDAPYSGYYAWTSCTRPASTSVCDGFQIVFNDRNPHPYVPSLACHEIGHAVGLQHQPGNNSAFVTSARTCMRSNPDVNQYSSHDVGHINARY